MAHSLSPSEKKAIDTILDEAETMFSVDRSNQASLQALDEQSKQLWGDEWEQSISGKTKLTTPTSSRSQTKPFSQMIREKNPSLFQAKDFDIDFEEEDDSSDIDYAHIISPDLNANTKTPNIRQTTKASESENDFEEEEEELNIRPLHVKPKSTPKQKDNDIESKILKKARESKLLASYRSDEQKQTKKKTPVKEKTATPRAVDKPKRISTTSSISSSSSKKKAPSLYQRSLKKEHIIESALDKYDIARLRQDNIEARNTIARLQSALDKANVENEKLRKALQESERIRMKQKTQITYILSEK